MEVSCRSPGSNSWEPFRPNSSQPRRKTDRLSYRRQQGTTDRVYHFDEQGGLQVCVSHWGVSSYQPSDGGGQSVDLLDQPWFDCTQQPAWRRGEAEIYWVSEGNLLVLLPLQTSETEWEWCHRLTRITGCHSPIRCGSPCLQSSSLLQPGEEGQEETDVREVGRNEGCNLHLFLLLINITHFLIG